MRAGLDLVREARDRRQVHHTDLLMRRMVEDTGPLMEAALEAMRWRNASPLEVVSLIIQMSVTFALFWAVRAIGYLLGEFLAYGLFVAPSAWVYTTTSYGLALIHHDLAIELECLRAKRR